MESEAAAAVSPERNGGEIPEADVASLRTKVLPPWWQHAHSTFSVSRCSRASADAVCPSWSATASRMSRCECWSASLGAGKGPRLVSSRAGSIRSARDAATALRIGACSIINIKPGRVGGYLESRRIHDLCQATGVPVWCGGMLETGIGRAANLALAALPGFTLPGDISATARYYERDITAPFVLDEGRLAVPDAPGIGIEPSPDDLEAATTSSEVLTF